tara:strand:- start:79 stop:498 length:420 start_codon:yes stop_codon:yes gene_type:complete
MHIIIRYEIERGLFSGDIKVDDIPSQWNQKMIDYLGVTVASDAEGCLQDVHWSAGLFGYFPTYTLGTILASQLYTKLLNVFPNFNELVQQGTMQPINQWLNEHIHIKGRSLTTADLLSSLGIGYDVDAFVAVIQDQFGI